MILDTPEKNQEKATILQNNILEKVLNGLRATILFHFSVNGGAFARSIYIYILSIVSEKKRNQEFMELKSVRQRELHTRDEAKLE